MENMATSGYKSTPLGDWVTELVNAVFFQPETDIAIKAMQEHFSPDLVVRINSESISRENYVSLITTTRSKYDLSVQFNHELLRDRENPDDDSEGSVAHLSNFILRDKQTGEAKAESSLVISTVKNIDGKKWLTELTEVYRSA